MTAQRWQEIKAILAEALEYEDAGERFAFVGKKCAGDEELRAEVEAFLAQDTERFDDFADGREAPGQDAGRRIGAYELTRELGRGGMGTVWLARRADRRFEHQVAIKLLKRGTDTEDVLRRFQAERQILARLNHPRIARLFDGGETDDGLPFFVMEYVEGVPITQYAREQRLSVAARLALFRQACEALSYAHRSLVIHRDLKPANVLVTPRGEIKLLDFGIAKLVQESEEAPGLATVTMQRPMTPAYASPEQLNGEPVTTVSDVFSLGVVLYELLAGCRPFDSRTPAPDGWARAITRDDPERPSAAALRSGASPGQERKALRGDLDRVVLKALHKEPARRYGSVNQLSEDIDRYLRGMPVRARPDTASYRLSKFVSRNKAPVIAAALAVLMLVGALLAATVQRNRAVRLSQRAEKGEENNRQLLYAAQMTLAYQAWQSANVLRALDLLEAQRPAPGHEDLRGFEWYLLWRLAHEQWRLLPGVDDRVRGVAFSRDGSKVAAYSVRGKVFVWDRAARVLLSSFETGMANARRVSFTADGNFIVTSGETAAQLWSTDGSRLVRSYATEQGAIGGAAISPDGRILATASANSTATLWNLETGEELLILRGHTAALTSVTFSPDGSLLATTSRDCSTKLWETSTGKTIATLRGHTWWVHDADFSPDGRTLATGGSDGEIKLWDVAGGREIGAVHGDGSTIEKVAFSPDGKMVADANDENVIRLHEVSTGKLIDTLRGHSDYIRTIAFSPDGRTIVSGCEDRSVRLWDLTRPSGALTLTSHKDWIWNLTFSPDGRTLASASKDATVKLWDAATGRERITLVHPLWVNGVAFSPNGERLATGSDDAMVRIWNPHTGAELRTLRGQEGIVECVVFSPDGRQLASGSKHGEIKLWNTETGQNLATFHSPANNLIWSLAFSADGKQLAAAEGGMNEVPSTAGHVVSIWDTQAGRIISTLSSHTYDVHSVAYSPDGHILASGSLDGTIKFWDAASYREVATLKTPPVLSLAFSADGKRMASAGMDKSVTLWDVATLQELCDLPADDLIHAVAFSPDNKVLAVGGNDHQIKLWFASPRADSLAQP